MNWQKSLFDSIKIPNQGLKNLAGSHYNAVFFFETITQEPSSEPEFGFDEFGNYVLLEEGGGDLITEIIEVKARIDQKTSTRKSQLEPELGVNTNLAYFEGRLTDPLTFPKILKLEGEVKAVIDGIEGRFTFQPQFSYKSTTTTETDQALGQRIRGYFEVRSSNA